MIAALHDPRRARSMATVSAILLSLITGGCGDEPAEAARAPVPARIPIDAEHAAALAAFEDPSTWEVLDGTAIQGWPQRVKDPRSEIVFLLVPSGEYSMGSTTYAAEMPRHRVRITKPFYMSRTEVTVGQWKRYVAIHGGDPAPPVTGEPADLPASQVSWLDAQEFCNRYHYALPTEAEWEYACVAGEEGETAYWADYERLMRFAWSSANSGERAHPVATLEPNAYGLHDTLGNVWEWCDDTFMAGYPVADPTVAVEDPRWTQSPPFRVLRGGSWFTMPPAYPTDRSAATPETRNAYHGFRVIRRVATRPD